MGVEDLSVQAQAGEAAGNGAAGVVGREQDILAPGGADDLEDGRISGRQEGFLMHVATLIR